ncbi:MAG TPA: DNA polymerase, partial [Thermoanaerobaculia bacterium]
MVDVPEKTRPRLFLIDGYALIYRAFFAMISRPLTTSKGENTSAAFGFTRFLLKLLEDYQPDYLGVVMDAGSSQRTELYADYKATREKMPDELAASMPRIRALMEAFRVPVIELQDFEADDVIGTLATRAAERGIDAVIVSGDKDFYQLISPEVSLLNPGRGGPVGVDEEWVDLRNASERLGVPPEHVVDYLALIGDSSDNIPGASGIGPKTAIKLIQDYGAVENIIERAAEISGKRPREAIEQHADLVRLSKQLVTIIRDLPVDLDLEALQVCEPDRDALRDLLVELEFHSLARDLAPAAPTVAKPVTYDVAKETKDVERLVAKARSAGTIAIDAITTSDDAMRAQLVGIAIATAETEATYLPLGHRRGGELALDDVSTGNLPALDSPALASLRALLEDASVTKVGHDLKYDLLLLRRYGIELGGLHFDTMLASYLIDPGRRDHGLDGLVLQYLKHHALAEDDVCGKGKQRVPMDEARLEDVARLGAERADLALRLHTLFEPELERYELSRLYHDIEMPLLSVLADMEQAGVRIDVDFFRRTAERLEAEIAALRAEIFEIAGGEFNINSTPQLREILFDRLQLPVLRRTKTGASTDASVLEELAKEGHRFPVLLLQFR